MLIQSPKVEEEVPPHRPSTDEEAQKDELPEGQGPIKEPAHLPESEPELEPGELDPGDESPVDSL